MIHSKPPSHLICNWSQCVSLSRAGIRLVALFLLAPLHTAMAAPDLDMSLSWNRLPMDVTRTIFEFARMTPTPSCVAYQNARSNYRTDVIIFQSRLRRHTHTRQGRLDYLVTSEWIIRPGLENGCLIDPRRAPPRDGIAAYFRTVSFDGGRNWFEATSSSRPRTFPERWIRRDDDFMWWPPHWLRS